MACFAGTFQSRSTCLSSCWHGPYCWVPGEVSIRSSTAPPHYLTLNLSCLTLICWKRYWDRVTKRRCVAKKGHESCEINWLCMLKFLFRYQWCSKLRLTIYTAGYCLCTLWSKKKEIKESVKERKKNQPHHIYIQQWNV